MPTWPTVRMLVFLAGLGLAVWIWQLRQTGETKYDLVGFAVIRVPPAAQAYAAAPRTTPKLQGPERNFIKDPELNLSGSTVTRRGFTRAGNPAAGGSAEARPETRRLVADAARIYFSVKRSPKFRNSPTIQAWERDFRSFPDLRAADDQYRRDHDGVRFLVEMGRSPNFRFMLLKYLGAADIQSFIQEVLGQPIVAGALRGFLEDFHLEAAASHLWPAVAAAPRPF